MHTYNACNNCNKTFAVPALPHRSSIVSLSNHDGRALFLPSEGGVDIVFRCRSTMGILEVVGHQKGDVCRVCEQVRE